MIYFFNFLLLTCCFFVTCEQLIQESTKSRVFLEIFPTYQTNRGCLRPSPEITGTWLLLQQKLGLRRAQRNNVLCQLLHNRLSRRATCPCTMGRNDQIVMLILQ